MTKKVYCGDPVAQFNSHKEEILEAIKKVCETGPYILGPEVEAFEDEFAAYNNVKYCIGVGSGTDALMLTMRSFDIGPGDEVITVSHTALATASAIIMTGATPVLVDIEEDFFTIDPEKIEVAITNKTKAIIPVHLYGQPCNMDAIMNIAKKHNLIVIEDCAQAHGATYKDKKVGSIGNAGCFSFYPTKNLGAIGDGGGIITNHLNIYQRLKRMRQYGWDENRVGQEISIVSRLDELQAAILRIKLQHLDQDNQKRSYIANQYKSLFIDKNILHPKEREHCKHVYHLYVIQTDSRESFSKKLSIVGLKTSIHYSHPIHLHPGYINSINFNNDGLKVTEKVINNILSLPMFPEFDLIQRLQNKEMIHV